MPPILSYHVHLVYSLSDEFALQQAIDLMNAARVRFASMLGACDAIRSASRCCVFSVALRYAAVGRG